MNHNQLILLIGLIILTLSLARRFSGFALSRPVSLLVSFVGLGLGGFLAFVALPVELLPNASFGVITITTPVRGGMFPSEIERQVTRPIEEAVSSVSHMRSLISNSKKDKSVVSIEFEPGTDMDFAVLDVREKFSRIKGDLPPEIETPIIAHYRESDVPIYIFALMSQVQTPEELRKKVDRDLKEKLLRIKGLANVEIAGGRERKIIVDVDRHRLASHGYDIRHIVDEIGRANVNVKTGMFQTAAMDTSIRAVGQFVTTRQIANTVIGMTKGGTALRVRDVAKVRDSFLERESISRLNAKSAVTVYLQKESGANTVRVIGGIKETLKPFQESLESDVEFLEVSNQAAAILKAISSVRKALLMGIVLVVVVLGVFLGLRPAFVVAGSIPLVILMTGSVMYFSRLSINVMTLSGLALAVGLLVDNSIVVLESIMSRRFPDHREILGITSGVTPAIIGGTLTTIVVFLPFFIFSSQIQILYSGVAITITAALLASLYVALTLVPHFSARFTTWRRHSAQFLMSRIIENLHFFYEKSLPWVLERKKQVLGVAIFLFLAALYVFQFRLEKNLSSGQEQNEFVIFVELPSGKQLGVSDEIVKEVEKRVRDHKDTASSIRTITTRIEGWSSKVYVSLQPPGVRTMSAAEVIENLRPVVGNVGEKEEAFVYFSAPVTDQEITVNIYGHDEETTVDYALQVAALMGQTNGLTDTKIRYRPGRPEVRVKIDPARTALFGLSPTEVGRILHAQTRGLRATYFREKSEQVETIVRLKIPQRDSVDSLKTLLIPAPGGRQIPLAQMADFDFFTGSL